MVCDTQLRERQTAEQRREEVKSTVDRLQRELAAGRVKVLVGKNGGITFLGFDAIRNGVSDACAYRKIMATGTATAKLAIAKAEQLAGRSIDRQAVLHGLHAHTGPDGKVTWHKGH